MYSVQLDVDYVCFKSKFVLQRVCAFDFLDIDKIYILEDVLEEILCYIFVTYPGFEIPQCFSLN